MNEPTKDDPIDECGLESVFRESRDGWRHWCDITEVFFRKADNTYWQVEYRKATGGDYHGLRDGEYSVREVEPHQVTKTEYRVKK